MLARSDAFPERTLRGRWNRYLGAPWRGRGRQLLLVLALIVRRSLPLGLETFFLCQWDLGRRASDEEDDPEIRHGRPADVDRFLSEGVQPALLPVKPDRGMMFLVMEQAGRPVAYMWLERRGFRIGQHRYLRLRPPGDAISGVMLWVAPDQRGRGLGPRLNRQARLECLARGVTRIVSTVDSLYRSSLRADEKVGYRRICHVTAARILGLALVYYSGCWHWGRWSTEHPFELEVPAGTGEATT